MGVVTKKQRQRMSDFVAELLQNSGKYKVIQDLDHILVQNPITERIGLILLHGRKRTETELTDTVNQNLEKDYYIGNIFYKDGENFHVRLAERAHFKRDKSLKEYDKPERDSALHLRQNEKIILRKQENILAYFQPETEDLDESLSIYKMQPIFLDYSHKEEGDDGYEYAKNGISTDFKMAKKILTINNGEKILLKIDKENPYIKFALQNITQQQTKINS